jgi:ribA/ribD-fused uncharacterized protein
MISDFHTPSTRFLSNFYVYPVTVFGCLWQSAEHAYQAQKFTTWPAQYARIKAAETPGKAKKLGRDSGIRKDWEQVKLEVMLEIIRAKFQDADLRRQLFATGDQELREGNHWGDTFWGVCNGRGDNHLGKILMQVRQEIQAEDVPL